MIIIKLLGGLGNQMFQYALFKALEKKGLEIKIDLSNFESYNLHNGFELKQIFNIDFQTATESEIIKLADLKGSFFSRVRRKLFGKKKSYINETNFSFDNIRKKKDYYLEGYWQSERFFANAQDDILKAFCFNNPISLKNKQLLKNIEQRNTVGLHVRRGDYISDPKSFKSFGDICNLEYYTTAISEIIKSVKEPLFIIFSDDMDWVKANLTCELETCFVDWNSGKESYWDMYLMSQCKHNIIANSSFSWWGAWLNTNPSKKIIAPEIWKWDNDSNTERTPGNWSRIPINKALKAK